jgi:hypothetical protein
VDRTLIGSEVKSSPLAAARTILAACSEEYAIIGDCHETALERSNDIVKPAAAVHRSRDGAYYPARRQLGDIARR